MKFPPICRSLLRWPVVEGADPLSLPGTYEPCKRFSIFASASWRAVVSQLDQWSSRTRVEWWRFCRAIYLYLCRPYQADESAAEQGCEHHPEMCRRPRSHRCPQRSYQASMEAIPHRSSSVVSTRKGKFSSVCNDDGGPGLGGTTGPWGEALVRSLQARRSFVANRLSSDHSVRGLVMHYMLSGRLGTGEMLTVIRTWKRAFRSPKGSTTP